MRGTRGKRLLASRGELVERSFAHCYETGGVRHPYLRGWDNVAKRVLIHAAGFNLGLLMRVHYKFPKPRSCSAKAAAAAAAASARVLGPVRGLWEAFGAIRASVGAIGARMRAAWPIGARRPVFLGG